MVQEGEAYEWRGQPGRSVALWGLAMALLGVAGPVMAVVYDAAAEPSVLAACVIAGVAMGLPAGFFRWGVNVHPSGVVERWWRLIVPLRRRRIEPGGWSHVRLIPLDGGECGLWLHGAVRKRSYRFLGVPVETEGEWACFQAGAAKDRDEAWDTAVELARRLQIALHFERDDGRRTVIPFGELSGAPARWPDRHR